MPLVALIVEDSRQFADILEITLAAVPNLSMVSVRDGKEAVRYLESSDGNQVCALLTDLQMPNMNGFELLEWLRSSTRYAALPVVVLSGDSDPATPKRALRLGANAYFSKPYSPAEVRHTVERLLDA